MSKNAEFFVKYYDNIESTLKKYNILKAYANFDESSGDIELYVQTDPKLCSANNKSRIYQALSQELNHFAMNVHCLQTLHVYDERRFDKAQHGIEYYQSLSRALLRATNNNDLKQLHSILELRARRFLFEDGVYELKTKLQHFLEQEKVFDNLITNLVEMVNSDKIAWLKNNYDLLKELMQYFKYEQETDGQQKLRSIIQVLP
jgi:hypothetical protein